MQLKESTNVVAVSRMRSFGKQNRKQSSYCHICGYFKAASQRSIQWGLQVAGHPLICGSDLPWLEAAMPFCSMALQKHCTELGIKMNLQCHTHAAVQSEIAVVSSKGCTEKPVSRSKYHKDPYTSFLCKQNRMRKIRSWKQCIIYIHSKAIHIC